MKTLMKQYGLAVMMVVATVLSGLAEKSSLANTYEVRLRSQIDNPAETILKRENLIRVQEFILQHGEREIGNGIHYRTTNFIFNLNPDSGQPDNSGDTNKTNYQNFTIYFPGEGESGFVNCRSLRVECSNQFYVDISTPWKGDLKISDIRAMVDDALKELLAKMKPGPPEDAVRPTRAPNRPILSELRLQICDGKQGYYEPEKTS